MKQTTLFGQTRAATAPRPGQRPILLTQMTLTILAALLALGLGAPDAQAQGYPANTIHSFATTAGDGQEPYDRLTNVNGTLYGTTFYGGTNTRGTIFSINPDGASLRVLHSFNGTDGKYPYAGLTNLNGTLYGTAAGGGDNGEVFSINADGTGFHVVHTFGGTDVASVGGDLVAVGNTLYGPSAGAYGAIGAINTDGAGLRVLHSFHGTDGQSPISSLIDVNGTLYGTTFQGGANNDGVVFAVNTDGTGFQVLHSFNGTDGNNPRAGLTNVNGTLYGTTVPNGQNNAGTVFAINTDGTGFQTLHIFNITDGEDPEAGLTNVNGILFGTTEDGGAKSGGTVFSINPDGTGFQIRYNFDGTAGGGSQTTLLYLTGSLYGTTPQGGTKDWGTVFVLSPGPIANSDTYAPRYQTVYVISAAKGVLANDDGDGNAMTASRVSNVTHGTLTLNSDGSFTYTPATGFLGTDTFTYRATSAIGRSNLATVTLKVSAAAPLAKNDTYTPRFQTAYVVKAPGILGNDTNYGTGAMTAALVTNPSHGTLTLNADGSYIYTPDAGYLGSDSFTYYATNAIGTSNTATVTLSINPVVPIAHNDAYTPKYATAYGVSAPGVLGNDDTGGTTPMTAALVANVAHGSLIFNSNGSFTYTPSAGFVGTDSFTYKDTTPTGTGNTATVTLNVTAAVPVAHNDAYTVAHNKAFVVHAPGVLANDYAGDSGSFTASLVSTTSHGILTFNTDGSFTYTPATGYSGTDTFTYKAKNSIGASNTASVTLTVR